MWFWKMLKVVCKVIWTWRKSNWILDKRSIGLNGHPSMNDSARINFLLCGHEIYSFGWPFLSHHYYITSLSNLCLVEEKMLLKTNSICTFLLIWQRPSTRSSASGVMIFTILIDPFLHMTNIYFVYLIHAQVYRRIFKRNNAISLYDL